MTDRACLYADRNVARLMFVVAAVVLGSCLGCVVYGFIAWVKVCP
jgi:phage shock protein PspC (stress-responsive transcriptional regulator)